MSFFASLFEKKVADASALTWTALNGGPSSKTGLSVTEMTAMRVTAVWACCRIISEDVGKLPLKLQQELPNGSKKIAKEHPLYRLLFRQPNDWQTSMEWRMTMMLHALLAKGGYSYINRNRATGEILELIPLMPGNVRPRQDSNWNVTYDVTDAWGKVATLQRADVHVLHGLSWNGLSGLEVVSQGREAIGLAMAAEETQARLHGQGARPGGILTTTATLTDPQVDRIKTQFAENYSGVANAFKMLLLDNGLKFEPWAMTGVDAEHLATRKHQVEEICRMFRVFPAMVGFSDKATTYGSAESFLGAHVVHTLMPWVALWEQAMSRDLLTELEIVQGYEARFLMQGLLRGDSKTRAAFYESAIAKACWMSRNEARRLEDFDPLPGLDEMLTPMNMQPAVEDPPAPDAGGIDDDDEEPTD